MHADRREPLTTPTAVAATTSSVGATAPRGSAASFLVTIEVHDFTIPLGVVAGDTLTLPGLAPITLRRDPLGPQRVALSSDSRYVAYEAAPPGTVNPAPRPGQPAPPVELRMLDRSTGRDDVLEAGADSPAWSKDGRLAYVRRSSEKNGLGDYVGVVMVRDRLDATAVAWTSKPEAWQVDRWIGSKLVLISTGADITGASLLSGPGQLQRVEGENPIGFNADASRALVTGGANRIPFLRLVDVASGREVTRLEASRLKDAATGGQMYLAGGGLWEGGRAVLAVARVNGSSSFGLVVVRVTDAAIDIERILDFGSEGVAAHNPRFADKSEEAVLAVAQTAKRPDVAVLRCDIASGRCLEHPLRQPRILAFAAPPP